MRLDNGLKYMKAFSKQNDDCFISKEAREQRIYILFKEYFPGKNDKHKKALVRETADFLLLTVILQRIGVCIPKQLNTFGLVIKWCELCRYSLYLMLWSKYTSQLIYKPRTLGPNVDLRGHESNSKFLSWGDLSPRKVTRLHCEQELGLRHQTGKAES